MDLSDPANVDVVKIAQVLHTAVEYYHTAASSPLAFPVVSSLCLLLLLLLVTNARETLCEQTSRVGRLVRRWRESRRMRRERKEFVERKFADIITCKVEEAVGDGTFTRKEAQAFYKRLGNAMTMLEITPRTPLLKRQKALKGRLLQKWKDKRPPKTESNGPKLSLLQKVKQKLQSA